MQVLNEIMIAELGTLIAIVFFIGFIMGYLFARIFYRVGYALGLSHNFDREIKRLEDRIDGVGKPKVDKELD